MDDARLPPHTSSSMTQRSIVLPIKHVTGIGSCQCHHRHTHMSFQMYQWKRRSLSADGRALIDRSYRASYASSSKSRAKNTWFARHISDPWVQAAERDGKRSRGSYKLQQILAGGISGKMQKMKRVTVGTEKGRSQTSSTILPSRFGGKGWIISPGDIVVDLGAAPGGWSQVCSSQ